MNPGQEVDAASSDEVSSSGEDPGLSWEDPIHEHDLPDEERLIRLTQVLAPDCTDEFSIRELDAWLSSEVVSRMLDAALIDGTETESHSQQVQTCEALEGAAATLIDRLQPVGLPDSLEQEMFAHWAGRVAEPPDVEGRRVDGWEALKARLVRDLQTLIPIAATTRATLEARGGRRGKPPNAWRNSTFAALAERIEPLLAKRTKENVASVAREAWNVYFPRYRMMEDETALRLLQRHSKSRRATT